MKNPQYTNQIRLTRNRGEVFLQFLCVDGEDQPMAEATTVAMTHDTFSSLRELFADCDAPQELSKETK